MPDKLSAMARIIRNKHSLVHKSTDSSFRLGSHRHFRENGAQFQLDNLNFLTLYEGSNGYSVLKPVKYPSETCIEPAQTGIG